MVERWVITENELGNSSLARKQNDLITQLATIGTEPFETNNGRVEDVARGLGGTLASPPLNVIDVQQYFGRVNNFP